jgi:hypothetical protein
MMQTPDWINTRRLYAIVLCSVVLTMQAGALDLTYTITGAAGTAMAFGGDLPAALAEFGDAVGADADGDGSGALYAPVLGASVGVGIDMELSGPLRASAGLEARRLGYAFWAPEISASSYLALWAAGLRLGVVYELAAWRFGTGASVLAPVSGISQSTSQGGAGLSVTYDVNAGRALIPGAYFETSLALGSSLALGRLVATPAAGFALGLWPAGIVDGIVDGVRSWQTSADMFVTFQLEKRTAR